MSRRLIPLLVPALLATGCPHHVPIHPRAVEEVQACAAFIDSHALDRAERHCRRALAFSPDDADAWSDLGLIEIRRGKRDAAEDDFIKAIRYNPDEAQAYVNLGGGVYLPQKRFGKAADALEQALKVNPDYTQARYDLALAYLGEKRIPEAKKTLRTIIEFRPTNSDAHRTLGLLLLQEGKVQKAIAQLVTTSHLAPKAAGSWLALGNAYAAAGRFQDAKDAFTSCLALEPDDLACQQNLPIVARKAAASAPDSDAKPPPETAEALYHRALELRARGQTGREEVAYRKCLAKDAHYAPCHWGLFQVFRARDDRADATVACRNFLRFASSTRAREKISACKHYLNGTF